MITQININKSCRKRVYSYCKCVTHATSFKQLCKSNIVLTCTAHTQPLFTVCNLARVVD